MHLLLLAAAVAVVACADDDPPAGAGGSGGEADGAGGSGGSGGEPACSAGLKVGAGEERFAAVTAGQELEVFIPEPGSQSASGHVWTSLLVRGFDPSVPLFVTLELFLDDGTAYGRARSCLHPLAVYGRPTAGWYEIPGLRATFPDESDPHTELAGKKLEVRVTLDDGARFEGTCARVEAACTVEARMEITPKLPDRP